MSTELDNDAGGRGDAPRRNPRSRRPLLFAAALLAAFLLGLVPMWLKARERAGERDRAQSALRVGALRGRLADAAIDARRGDYEPARQAASEFYSGLSAELARGADSAFDEARRNALRAMFDARDDTITLLARSDPASADRLSDLYQRYRQAAGGAPPPR
ncbi:MAG TPA: hypothetical protein VF668_11845 [Pyrinomonadaceae bacterium]|jgi:hypothetical protein